VPFLLEGVAGSAELNLEDGIHPNADGHRLMAETVAVHLERLLRERAQPASGGGELGRRRS
jgi:acyl-CoA thioesterase-1